MNIAAVVAWMWMAAQMTSSPVVSPSCAPNVEWCSDMVNSELLHCPTGFVLWEKDKKCHISPVQRIDSVAPAEHVIEIRTKRDEAHPQCPATWVNFDETAKACKCPTGYPLVIEGDAALSSVDCIRVTREIWIDGKKWGVLKESGQ